METSNGSLETCFPFEKKDREWNTKKRFEKRNFLFFLGGSYIGFRKNLNLWGNQKDEGGGGPHRVKEPLQKDTDEECLLGLCSDLAPRNLGIGVSVDLTKYRIYITDTLSVTFWSILDESSLDRIYDFSQLLVPFPVFIGFNTHIETSTLMIYTFKSIAPTLMSYTFESIVPFILKDLKV